MLIHAQFSAGNFACTLTEPTLMACQAFSQPTIPGAATFQRRTQPTLLGSISSLFSPLLCLPSLSFYLLPLAAEKWPPSPVGRSVQRREFLHAVGTGAEPQSQSIFSIFEANEVCVVTRVFCSSCG